MASIYFSSLAKSRLHLGVVEIFELWRAKTNFKFLEDKVKQILKQLKSTVWQTIDFYDISNFHLESEHSKHPPYNGRLVIELFRYILVKIK